MDWSGVSWPWFIGLLVAICTVLFVGYLKERRAYGIPKPGDILRITDADLAEAIGEDALHVVSVYRSWNEDWGPDGESAWAAADAEEEDGRRAAWYAICGRGGEGEWIILSYEAEIV